MGISLIIFSEPPASNKSTRTDGSSDRRLASTDPADPPPTIMYEKFSVSTGDLPLGPNFSTSATLTDNVVILFVPIVACHWIGGVGTSHVEKCHYGHYGGK